MMTKNDPQFRPLVTSLEAWSEKTWGKLTCLAIFGVYHEHEAAKQQIINSEPGRKLTHLVALD